MQMQTTTIAQITDSLRKLPAEKLAVVYVFVCFISEREIKAALKEPAMKSFEFMLATEAVLRRDWDRPEEDAAWANL
jgi:hypothetical protein